MLIYVRLLNCDHGGGYRTDDPATIIQSQAAFVENLVKGWQSVDGQEVILHGTD
jgi:hypothetical protein